jgi:N-acetylglutamate synthase-like GNAT family acetyltransferase
MIPALSLPLSIVYRKGEMEDLSNLRISRELSATSKSIEFNVVGIGHEFWIAVEDDIVVGMIVLGRESSNQLRIMYLEIAPSHKGKGVGSSLIQAILSQYPDNEFSVIPFEGTADFYGKLGFNHVNQWEMRKSATH